MEKKSFLERWAARRKEAGPLKVKAQFFDTKGPGVDTAEPPPLPDAPPPMPDDSGADQVPADAKAPVPEVGPGLDAAVKKAAESAFAALSEKHKDCLADIDKGEAVDRLATFLTNDIVSYIENGDYLKDAMDMIDPEVIIAFARGGTRLSEEPKKKAPAAPKPPTEKKEEKPAKEEKPEKKKEKSEQGHDRRATQTWEGKIVKQDGFESSLGYCNYAVGDRKDGRWFVVSSVARELGWANRKPGPDVIEKAAAEIVSEIVDLANQESANYIAVTSGESVRIQRELVGQPASPKEALHDAVGRALPGASLTESGRYYVAPTGFQQDVAIARKS